MFRRLLPRNDEFFDFFERHAAMTVQGAEGLLGFATSSCDPLATFQHIKNCEQEGDIIVHQCMDTLHKTFITPFERGDIHYLISTMDDVLDEIKDVGQLIILYRLNSLQKESVDLANILWQSTRELEGAVKELRKLKNTPAMQNYLYKINHLENEADTIYIQALKNLFDEEKDTLTIIKWKEIYEHLEKATDASEDVANILEGIVLECE